MAAFLSGTTCRSLVHKLGCVKPRSTKELLDIATNQASGEEAVGAIFVKGEAKRADNKEVTVSHHDKKKKGGKAESMTMATMTQSWSRRSDATGNAQPDLWLTTSRNFSRSPARTMPVWLGTSTRTTPS